MKNLFEIFALPVQFEIDLNYLEQKYFELQIKFHPDFNQESSVLEDSISINEAYEVLKDNLKRAIHILNLNSFDIADDKSSIKPDSNILKYVLEIQEKIFESSESEISEIKQNIENEISQIFKKISANFKMHNFQDAIQDVIKIKYLDKILKDLKK